MEKIISYLDRIPLELLITAPVIGLIVYFQIPLRKRLSVMLATTFVWLVIAICPGLGVFKDLFKILLPAMLALLVFTAYRDPHPRLPLPGLCKLYLVLAAAQFLYVLGTQDRINAMVYCLQWLLMVLAAFRIVQSITTWERLKHVMFSVTVGATTGSLFLLSSFHKREYSLDAGRYWPYDAHPNHVGITLIISSMLCFLWAQQTRNPKIKMLFIALGSLSFMQLIMTVSRTSIAAAFPPILVLCLHYAKRPAQVVMAIFVLSIVLMVGIEKTSKFRYERLGSLKTPRTQIYTDYLADIETRPFTGLMFSRGRSMQQKDQSVNEQHVHSSYIYALYIGGLSFAMPLFFLAAASLFSALHLWMNRNLFPHRLVELMCMFMVTCYLIGVSITELYKPVNNLAFVSLLFSMTLIGIASDKKRLTAIYQSI